jgi:hypothetical protein
VPGLLRNPSHPSPREPSEARPSHPEGGIVVIVDGYEQLASWGRFLLRLRCRRSGLGLLVTAHEPVGLPDLYRVSISPEMAQRVVDHLLAPMPSPTISPADVSECLAARSGNLREALFDLYDRHEHRRCVR